MAVYKIGSQGEDVKKLQQQLLSAGYDPQGIDGVFGPKTQAAVTAFQKAKGLSVDGIAGKQTMGALSTPVKTPAIPAIKPAAGTITPDVDPNAADKALARQIRDGQITAPAADAAIKNLAANTPTVPNYGDLSALNNIKLATPAPQLAYKDPYEDKINSILDKLLNYNPNVPYDVTTDPMYAPMKQQYDNAGQSAFNNQIGRMSALTGGRPSTAAVGTAAAAQNNYAQQFAGTVLPSLIAQEQNKRQSAYDSLAGQLRTLQGLGETAYDRSRYADETAYGRSRDAMTDKANALKAQVDTMGQYSNDYQAEINRRLATPDTEDDALVPSLRVARQEKIASMGAGQTAAQKNAATEALALWKTLGKATPEIAKVLGVPVNARTADYDVDSMNAATSAKNATTSRINAEKSGSDTGKPTFTNSQILSQAQDILSRKVAGTEIDVNGSPVMIPQYTKAMFETWLYNAMPKAEDGTVTDEGHILFDDIWETLDVDNIKFYVPPADPKYYRTK